MVNLGCEYCGSSSSSMSFGSALSSHPPPLPAITGDGNAPFSGAWAVCTWNTRGLLSPDPSLYQEKVAVVKKLLRSKDILLLQEVMEKK